jgi:undecaprenyl-diphosphatase
VIDLWQVLALALVQGLTEFLPISSSAHLVIPPIILGWPDQGLAFDVAVHVGTLSAVLIYYRRDLRDMLVAWLRSLTGGAASDDSRLVWYLAVATIPAGVVGLVAGDYIELHLRNLGVIATTTLVFGLLLGVAQRRGAESGAGRKLNLPLALAVGMAQALAPVPGVSRSGVTITAGLMLGMDRQGAARFSFLLSIPIIASAGALKLGDLAVGGAPVDWDALVTGAVVSAVTAYLCIALFLRLLDRVGLMPFVYYRIALAVLLYIIWLS